MVQKPVVAMSNACQTSSANVLTNSLKNAAVNRATSWTIGYGPNGKQTII